MKLVNEHIIIEKFSEDSDPIDDMKIGVIRKIDEWINYINTTSNNLTSSLYSHNFIDSYKLNLDSTIDVGDSKNNNIYDNNDNYSYDSKLNTIVIRGSAIKCFPYFINFNNCYGNCYLNVSTIESLRGCPKIIYGHLCINSNKKLQKIDFFPDIVYGNIYCDSGVINTIEKYKSHVKGKIVYV